MNICDDPKRVSVGTEWREADILQRTPIIVTGLSFDRDLFGTFWQRE